MVYAGYLVGCLLLLASIAPTSGLCRRCLEEKCYDNGECILGCLPGFVGQYCEQDCPSTCLNKVCHLHITSGAVTCTDGCEAGYCDVTCAVSCPRDCVTCDRQCGSCNVAVCPARRFGAGCNGTCSPKYNKCDRETGECIICRRGYYGDECHQKCANCLTRAETIKDKCLSGCNICKSQETCPTGFHGEVCGKKCSSGCSNPGGCNRATGECSTGCVSRYYGLSCNNKCIGYCLSGKCDRATGECPDGCMSGYHGLTCNNRCNKFCVGGICNQNNGICTSGCDTAYVSNLDKCDRNSGKDFYSYGNVVFNSIIGLVGIAVTIGLGVFIVKKLQGERCSKCIAADDENGTHPPAEPEERPLNVEDAV